MAAGLLWVNADREGVAGVPVRLETVVDGPEMEEREVTCANKVSIVFRSSYGPGVA